MDDLVFTCLYNFRTKLSLLFNYCTYRLRPSEYPFLFGYASLKRVFKLYFETPGEFDITFVKSDRLALPIEIPEFFRWKGSC
jgi:hypothetical protein